VRDRSPQERAEDAFHELEATKTQHVDSAKPPADAWDSRDLAQSLIAVTAGIDTSVSADPRDWIRNTISLIRWKSPTRRAGSYRLAFAPVRGRGTVPWPAIGGATRTPGISPPLDQANLGIGPVNPLPDFADGARLRIRWGVGGAVPHELFCDYPARGGCCDLVADQVQVDVWWDLPRVVVAVADPNLLPVFGATLGPTSRIESLMFGLSASYSKNLVAAGTPITFMVPQWARTLQLLCNVAESAGNPPFLATWVDVAGGRLAFAVQARAGATLAGLGGQCMQPVPSAAAGLLFEPTIASGAGPIRYSFDWRLSP
jgi:hypothetical protein